MMRIWDDLTPEAQSAITVIVLIVEAFLLWG